eukprot:TRINITY_DN766_c0_g1_i9.p1 TRINITY_DN766_c0_g1~~TRINITY_DN766_c0_g1_i9.p1  ORF type:complete len:863 (+),score=154.53 TRINITY_DN766_c0_g1_i9:76-2589(+)
MNHLGLIFLLGAFFVCAISRSIYQVDVSTLSSMSSQNLLSSVTNFRNSPIFAGDYFILTNVTGTDGLQHKFIVRQNFWVNLTKSAAIFTGYHFDAYSVRFFVQIPFFNVASLTGVVKWENGEHCPLKDINGGLAELPAEPRAVMYSPLHLGQLPEKEVYLPYTGPRMTPDSHKKRNVEAMGNYLQVTLFVVYDSQYASLQGGEAAAQSAIKQLVAELNAVTLAEMNYEFKLLGVEQVPPGSLTGDGIDDLASYNTQRMNADIITGMLGKSVYPGAAGLASLGICGSRPSCWVATQRDPHADLIIFGQESNHVFKVGHTHDEQQFAGDYIDNCAQGYLPPDKLGSIMSYCQSARDSAGWKSVAASFGSVGKYGTRSERMPQLIRRRIDEANCLQQGTSSGGSSGSSGSSGGSGYSGSTSSSGYSGYSGSTSSTGYSGYYTTTTTTTTTSTSGSYSGYSGGYSSGYSGDSSSGYYSGGYYGTTGFFGAQQTLTSNEETQPATMSCRRIVELGWCSVVQPQYCSVSCATSTSTAPLITPPPLFDQGEQCTTNRGIPSVYLTSLRGMARAMDQFVVPSGEVWAVDVLHLMGVWVGPLPTEDVHFHVVVFNQGKVVYTKGVNVAPFTEKEGLHVTLRLPVPIVTIGASLKGDSESMEFSDQSYYLSIAAHVDNLNQGNFFLWSFTQQANDDKVYFEDPLNDFNTNCTSWTPVEKCGLINPEGQGMCFSLEGKKGSATKEDSSILTRRNRRATGGIGQDTGHAVPLTLKDAKEKVTQRAVLIDNHKTSQAALAVQVVDNTGSLANRPGWAIGLLVLFSVGIVLSIAIIVAVFVKRRNSDDEHF